MSTTLSIAECERILELARAASLERSAPKSSPIVPPAGSCRSSGPTRSAAAFAARERGRVLDASLCHGSAGLGHLFGVLGSVLTDEELRGRAAAWHAVTLAVAMRTPGEGIAGFYYSHADEAGGVRRKLPDPSLRQGASGVGLSLLAALDGYGDRSWDRMLLPGRGPWRAT